MRPGSCFLLGVMALCALASGASAQPRMQPREEERPTVDTTIPVTVDANTEVMTTAESPDTSPAAMTIAIEEPVDPEKYVCGSGDTFELNFWGKQNFRLKIAADLEGRTFISKVGFVVVAGKTLTQVRTQITKKVRANYPGLQFDLTLLAPRTFRVHMVENVKEPGSYPAQAIERVSTLVARAGGVLNGSRRSITVHRKSGATLQADLIWYELTGDTSKNPYVLDGDVISVPFPASIATISGAVRRPGTYELIKSKDLAELLELAGGLSPTALKSRPIKVIRRNANQQAVVHEFAFSADGANPNESLRDDDDVTVESVLQVQRTVLLIGAVIGADALDAAATSKRLPYVEGDTVLSLLDRAGGLRAPGDLARSYISRIGKDGLPELTTLDLDALLVRRDFTADKKIFMGDTIVVPPMRHSILVEGAVGRAGLYTYNPRFGVPEYIAHAGGRSRTAQDLSDVRLIEPTGTTRPYKKGMRLSPGDAILVPERNFTRAEVVQIVIASAGLVLSGVAIVFAATR